MVGATQMSPAFGQGAPFDHDREGSFGLDNGRKILRIKRFVGPKLSTITLQLRINNLDRRTMEHRNCPRRCRYSRLHAQPSSHRRGTDTG